MSLTQGQSVGLQPLAVASPSRLQEGRRQMAERCEKAARAMMAEAGVKEWIIHNNGLRGRASVRARRIRTPPPTTRRRLYILAHECGHVALVHLRAKKPSHRQEYEAEVYAHDALRRHGIAVPKASTEEAKCYVARKIRQAILRGAKHVDREALAWSREFISWEVKRWLAHHNQK